MEPSTHLPSPPRALDLTGLSSAQQQTIEALVEHFRNHPSTTSSVGVSYDEWAQAFRAWVESHPRRDTLVDDSRESIYAGRGE